jgi:hypothetical protein
MRNGKRDSSLNSDTIFVAERPNPPQRRSERRFLFDQAANARFAMVRTVHGVKETLITMTDLNSCAKRRPWIVAGSAVAVGFVASVALSCTLRKKSTNIQAPLEANVHQGCQRREMRTRKLVMLATAGRFLASVLQTLVQGFLTTAFFSKQELPTGTPMPLGSTETVVPGGRID